jgi:hypothetical protein
VTWVDSSKIKRNIMKYSDKVFRKMTWLMCSLTILICCKYKQLGMLRVKPTFCKAVLIRQWGKVKGVRQHELLRHMRAKLSGSAVEHDIRRTFLDQSWPGTWVNGYNNK